MKMISGDICGLICKKRLQGAEPFLYKFMVHVFQLHSKASNLLHTNTNLTIWLL